MTPLHLDQQGNDRGPQYRSVIFYHNEEQKRLSEEYKAELNKSGAWSKPVITCNRAIEKLLRSRRLSSELLQHKS
ncbi:MAG: peptide-methionine (S)-S-oxide reductase [Segetibacter sp.]